MQNLSKTVKLSQAITVTAGAAGTSAINGAVVDMSAFEGLFLELTMGAIVTGAATSIKLQHGDVSDLSDAADIAGTNQTIADSDDNKTYYIDLYKPTKRYVRVVVSRATQNATVASATYMQYDPRLMPVTHGTNVSGETHISPISGTA